MRKIIYIFVGLSIVLYIFSCNPEEYYIPKPKAQIKIKLPSEETSVYVDDIMTFNYSKSAFINKKGENLFSIVYPDYDASINISIKPIEYLQKLVIDDCIIVKDSLLDTLDVPCFVYKIAENCRLGAKARLVQIDSLTEENIYGDICYFYGDKFALSSIFFLTDDNQYFLDGFVMFNNQVITNEIVLENEIMKKEIANIINSFQWSSIPK